MPADADQREARQRAIRVLLERRRIGTQSELVRLLREREHGVTQSSISRDLTELGAVKIDGAYRIPGPLAATPDERRIRTFGLITGYSPAGDHLLVVRTPAGAAQIVAAALDALELPDAVGTLAGDDTLFVATAGRAQQRRLALTLDALSQGGSPQ